MVTPKKISIIGAGIAGLATAIRLASKGHAVEVFEANKEAGGKMGELKMDGFRFDTGPSLFTMPHYVEELFTLAGKDFAALFPILKKETICNYYFANGNQFTASANKQTFIEEASVCFNTSPKKIEKYLANSQLKFETTTSIFLEKSLHKLSTYVSIETLIALLRLPQLHLNQSLHSLHNNTFSNPDLIQLFDRYATYNGSSPYKTPGIMSLIPHLEQHYGCYLPKNGMKQIATSLYQLALDMGVQFHFSSFVDEILIENKKAIGIRSQEQKIMSDYVVCNMDVLAAYKKLLPSQKAPQQTLTQERSSSALIFYWGIRNTFPQIGLHNIFFAKDYANEFKKIFDDKEVADDITIYINCTSKDILSDAPTGCENWFVMVNVPSHQNQNWDVIIHRTRKNIIQILSKHLDCAIESYIACEQILDPRSIEANTQSSGGALYGSSSNNKFAAFLRHPNFSQQISQLYFCGGSVHPGGGIPLCLLSAKITSELILAACD